MSKEVILGACLVVSVNAQAFAAPADRASPFACLSKQPLQLEIFEVGTQLGLVSPAQVVGPPGAPPPAPGAGIASVMVADLKVGEQKVGVMTGHCLTVGAAPSNPAGVADEIQVCNQTLSFTALPPPYEKISGKVVVNGPINRAEFHGSPNVAGDGVEQVLPVVGGTGSFRGARGQLRVRESSFAEHVQVWSLSDLLCL